MAAPSQPVATPEDSTSVRVPWESFLYLATWAFLLYGIGAATPYLRADLSLTAFEAGLHGSALAVGVLTAGLSADRVERWVGANRLPDLASLAIGTGIALIAFAPGLPASLTGALLMGLGGGTLGVYVNVRINRSGGQDSRRMFSQANALAMVTAALAPITIGLAASELHAWRLALTLPVATYVALAIVRPRQADEQRSVRIPNATLPAAYWFAWLLIALVVSIEFSFVFWGSTVVAQRTGISSGNATLLASLFVAGMFLGRAAIGRGFGSRREPRLMIVAGLAVALMGACLVWVSTISAISGLGLFLGGLGTAGLYPVAIAVALQAAPRAPFEAAARATLAAGIAVLLAPSTLGLAADAFGIVGAWGIIPGLAVAAAVVMAITPRSSPRS
ncbi:MAG TPA: MFS transporter [Candidatus Limnocylindrales bacterium]